MIKKAFPIVGGYNLEKDPKIDCQRTVNLYATFSQAGKTPSALIPFPGIKADIYFSRGEIVRGVFTNGDYLYVVVSEYVYRVLKNKSYSTLGIINTSSGPVNIEANNNGEIIFVDGVDGWLYNPATSTFQRIPDIGPGAEGFPPTPEDVCFLDGYFIVNKGSTNRFYLSDFNDGAKWQALQFVTLQSKPDIVVGLESFKRRLYVFGTHATEVWFNAGTSPMPLRRDSNQIFEYGCVAKSSIAVGGTEEDKKLFWLAGDSAGIGAVMMTDGSTPRKISTQAVECAIQGYINPKDAIGFVYKIDGHLFYELSFSVDNHTWVYDATTNLWFEKEYINGGRYIVNNHVFYNGTHLFGAVDSPILYKMHPDFLDDDGVIVNRYRITQHFAHPEYKKIRISRANIDMTEGRKYDETIGEIDEPLLLLETGASILFEDGGRVILEDNTLTYSPQTQNNIKQSDNYIVVTEPSPDILFSFSKDGGVSFGPALRLPVGKLGNRLHRTIARRLGSSRANGDWVFKIEYANRLKLYLLGMVLEYDEGGR